MHQRFLYYNFDAMIFYFSGTGNSRLASDVLSKELGEQLVFIPDVKIPDIKFEGESLGFVFPVYSWGVPPLVMEFVKSLPESFIEAVKGQKADVWCVLTCGDEVALAPEMFENAMSKRGITLNSIWSVIMPNNYVLLPGFDVDSKEVERMKLKDAPTRLKKIASGIKEGEGKVDVTRGSLAALKTKCIYPLFRKWGIFPKKWRSTDMCVACGICAESCPLHNITMKDNHPRWGKNCCSCLACYHSCPRHAVAYGSSTKKKGQYFLPRSYRGV